MAILWVEDQRFLHIAHRKLKLAFLVGLQPLVLKMHSSDGGRYQAALEAVRLKRREISRYYKGDTQILSKAPARFQNHDSERLLVALGAARARAARAGASAAEALARAD